MSKKPFKLLIYMPAEGVARMQLPSGEKIGIWQSIEVYPKETLVRIAKSGFLGVISTMIWKIIIRYDDSIQGTSPAQIKNGVSDGNVLCFDPHKYSLLVTLIGFCSKFESIAHMQAYEGQISQYFNVDDCLTEAKKLGG